MIKDCFDSSILAFLLAGLSLLLVGNWPLTLALMSLGWTMFGVGLGLALSGRQNKDYRFSKGGLM